MSYAQLINELNVSTLMRGDAQASFKQQRDLSEEQFAAYSSPFSQSAVVCAGAGAGKTRLLVERVAGLLKAGVNPKRIAVVAFTRKSAQEIIHRLQKKLGAKDGMPVCSTVHSLAYGLLKKEGQSTELSSPEQEALILGELKEILPAELEELSDSELLLQLHRAREERDRTSVVGLLGYSFEELLRGQGLNDFTSLLFRASETVRDLFDYVLVDEAQDLSQLQLTFLTNVAPKAIFWYIGDPDQSIYAFRGAHQGMMQTLEGLTDTVHVLSTNYRCAQSIVWAGNAVISNNPRPFKVQWSPARSDAGLVKAIAFETAAEEHERTLAWLMAKPLHRAVLARTQAQLAFYKGMGQAAYTVHEAKGLEWPEVRVLGCEEGLFPHPMSEVPDERRLFYVAMTRAMNSLELSYCATRSGKKVVARTPSRFIQEAGLMV